MTSSSGAWIGLGAITMICVFATFLQLAVDAQQIAYYDGDACIAMKQGRQILPCTEPPPNIRKAVVKPGTTFEVLRNNFRS